MAISFVGSSTWEAAATNGGNVSVTISSVSSGDYILVAVGIGSSTTPTITVTSSSTSAAYTSLLGGTLKSSSMSFDVFGKLLTAAETTVQSFGTGRSSDSATIVVMAFRGVRSSNPIDATTTSTTGTGTTPDSPSITVASCGCAIISAVNAQVTDTTVTAPSSFLNQIDINANDNWDTTCGMAWITHSATSSFNPTSWSNFTSATWGSATIALSPEPPPTITYLNYFSPFPDFYRTTELVGY